jgi:hypothetical protein
LGFQEGLTRLDVLQICWVGQAIIVYVGFRIEARSF